MSLSKAIAPLARRVSNMLARGSVTLSNASGKLQTLQIALLSDEAKDTVEHFEPFGFTSNPKPGAEVLTAFIEGDRSHGIVVMATDRRYRIQNLLPGEMAIYDDHGGFIKLTQAGIVISGGGHPISINNAASVTITGGDIIADGISLKGHKHGGVTAGSAQTGLPV